MKMLWLLFEWYIFIWLYFDWSYESMYKMSSDGELYKGGYWEPHSSSVDFCEPNYYLTSYVAEPHNCWSSLFISFIGLMGILYGNPTKEMRFTVMFTVLILIGLGSALLHMTLHWIPQSSDELPMLWISLSYLHSLFTMKDGPGVKSSSAIYIFLVALVQTVLYYSYQHVYFVFIASMVLYSVIIIVWTIALVNETGLDPSAKSLRVNIGMSSFVCYVFFGFGCWILDMNYCDTLLPYYLNSALGGCTLHVFWHIFASFGTYLNILFFIVVRVQFLKRDARLKWIFGFIPICTIKW